MIIALFPCPISSISAFPRIKILPFPVELTQFIKGPDFPTAGAIYDAEEIKNVYSTGKGRILIRGKAEIEEIGQGKSAIIITELP
ncbi:MAG TPA: DNA gyrase subunit A, partial [Thermodesulfobacteriota bacterium]|nr:DNA gyrase subunit A [Thermodesulfobacteriota bacterium]